MADLTINVYKKMQNGKALDSVLVANYLKKLVLGVPFGLIPRPIRSILIGLLKDYASDAISPPPHVVLCVFSLLSLSTQRLEILRNLADVARVIFDKCTVDPISKLGLARVLIVFEKESFDSILENAKAESKLPKAISDELDVWYAVFGYILEKAKLFLRQV